MMKRIFIDMDGVLAEWKPCKTLEDLYLPGYFAALKPQSTVVDAVKELLNSYHGQVEVFVLSAVFEDCPYAIPDKNKWLNLYLPEIDQEHRIFASASVPKFMAVPGGIRNDDLLLDDYTVNLLAWSYHAKGVKLLNGINHSRGTWRGAKIHKDAGPKEIAEFVTKQLDGRETKRQRNLTTER